MSEVLELICPTCRGPLQLSHGRVAKCSQHGGEYEILFDRAAAAVPTQEKQVVLTSVASCIAHPRQPALFDCETCARPMCGTCVFEVRGRHYCSDCALAVAQAPPAPSAAAPVSDAMDSHLKECPMCGLQNPENSGKCNSCGHVFGLLNLSGPARRTVPVDLRCVQHPETQAVARCRLCASGMCGTCDFQFAGGVHVCPACVEKDTGSDISPRRKKCAVWGLALAGFSSMTMALMLLGVMHRFFFYTLGIREGANVIIGNMVFLPTIAGTAVSFTALDRRLKNPPMVRTAVIWNSILLAFYMILIVIGLSR